MKKRLDGILHILERKRRLDLKVKSISARKTSSNKSSPKSGERDLTSAVPVELMQVFMEQLGGSVVR